jgi:hypothetical protein
MSAPLVSHHDDDGDDAARAAALLLHQRQQTFLKKERGEFIDLAREDFTRHASKLLDIYHGALVDVVHFAPAFEIALMVKFMHKLGLGARPAAYGYGGYQEGQFKLPDGETDVTTQEKILRHTFRCAPSSIILRDLVDKKPTPIPWQTAAAGHSLFRPALKPGGSWDKAKLIGIATERQSQEERILKGLLLKTGPWLTWFYPDPGAWADNWYLCAQFTGCFNCLPDSVRLGFTPYLFTIVSIDPSAVAAPSPAPPTATASVDAPQPDPAPAPTTPPPFQYPHDDQAL